MDAQIKSGLKRYARVFKEASGKNLNEADTVLRLTRFFEEVLGYDPFNEITREQAIKGTFVDIALKADGEIRILVEAKAAGVSLREGHTQQAQNYAANRGIPWVLLTNGSRFILYRIQLDGAIEATEVFDVDIVNGSPDRVAERLAMIHRKAIRKGADLEKFYQLQRTLSPEMILKALSSEAVVTTLCRELRTMTGTRAPEEDVFAALKSLLKESALLADLRIRRKPRPERSKKMEREIAATEEG